LRNQMFHGVGTEDDLVRSKDRNRNYEL